MKKLDKLSEIIDQNLKHITVTDALKEQIILNLNKTPMLSFKRIAISTACFAVIFLIITIIWSGNIVSAFKPLIKYIPGINSLIFNDEDTFALDGTITIKSEDGTKYIEILSCFTDNNIVKAVLRGNIPVEWSKSNSVLAIDERGNEGKLVECNIMSDGTQGSPDYEWIGTVNFKFKSIVDKFDLKLAGFKIPVIMSRIEGVTNFEDFGNISYANGIRVAALTKYSGDLLEVKIIGLSDNGKKIFSFANGNVYLIDKHGNRYSPVSPPGTADTVPNKFYFDARLKDDLKLVIPYIILAGDGEKTALKLEIPQAGTNPIVDLPFKIGDYSINIVELRRSINDGKIYLRHPDGKDKRISSYSQTGLQIVVDKKFDYSMKDGLYDFSYICNKDYLSIPNVVDGKKTYYIPGNDMSDKKYSEPRYKIISLPNFPSEKKSLDITFTDPLYYRRGDWIITLKK